MSFTTVKLTDQRVLVKGNDSTGTEGETVISSVQWDEIQAQSDLASRQKDFDDAVEVFFAPLVEAQEALEAKPEEVIDPLSFVTLREGTEHTQGVSEVRRKLNRESQILRLIEQGQTERLVWVAGDLEVTEYVAPKVTPAPVEDNETNDLV